MVLIVTRAGDEAKTVPASGRLLATAAPFVSQSDTVRLILKNARGDVLRHVAVEAYFDDGIRCVQAEGCPSQTKL